VGRLAASVQVKLLEREQELRRISNLLDGSLEGRGGVVVVEGPAGIGKTRLVEATCRHAAQRGLLVLSARGSDLERHFPYGVVRQLLETMVVSPAGKTRDSPLRGPAAYAEPVFATAGFDADADGAADRSEAVVHGLHWLMRNLAERSPVLLAVDDAHWADAPSLAFIHYLAGRVEALPVAVVVSLRRSQAGQEADLVRRIAAGAPERVLVLGPLSGGATAKLVRSLLGTDPGDELCAACHTATGGNPFLVHELATALVDEEAGPDGSAAARVGRLVPDAVARHVLVRLSRLGSGAARVAQAVAVLGSGAELRHATSLTGLPEAEVAGAVDALVSADVLSPGLPLEFAHPLLREAVYLDALPGQRVLAHARAARILADSGSPPERVASQLLATDPADSEWAAKTLQPAAREATSRGAPGTAAEYLERALREPPPPGDRRELLRELGVAESRATQPGAAEHLGEALRLTADPVGRARVAQELAGLYNLLGRFGDSATVLESAIDVLDDDEEELRFSLEAELAVLAITVLESRRRLAPRIAALRAEVAGGVGDSPAAAPLLAVLAHELANTDGTADEVAAYAERAFADGTLVSREGPVASIGTAALVMADRPARAEAILDAVISAARSRGSLQALRAALAGRAQARNRLGRIAEAEADARRSLELSAHEPFDPVRPYRLAQLADALIEQAQWEEAESLLTSDEPAYDDPGSLLDQPLRESHARLLLLRGRPQDARPLVVAQLRWQREWGYGNAAWTPARSTAALVHAALDESDESRALAAEDLDVATAYGAPRSLGVALRTAALVEPGAGISRLRESVAALERSEAPLELARTLVELGAALRRTGARRDARPPLRRGLELTHACGGALLAERARAELLAAGARPRSPLATGRAALTPSESRVATMASEGLSNREIAGTLFLSRKTVEMHLTHVYRKLDISSRTELAGALGEGSRAKNPMPEEGLEPPTRGL
jgi:DNA-binding CsgD family transcriptional regulator/tetratricopeptide (TPR) repeat protein